MPDADGIERGPAATPEDFVKAIEKRELPRLQVSKVGMFWFEGERVSKWLELLEQVTGEASDEDKFKLLPRHIWWEIRPEIMKVAAGAGGDWAKFKGEMQRRFKLGDGLLTKADLEMLQRDEFTTVGAFATTFEKMARKVPGMAEEKQCATFLGHFTNWEASALTKKGVSGKKLTWDAIKESVIDGELDQVDIFQMRQARKKRKALDATTSDGRDFKKMVEDAVAQLDAAKEAKATRKAMAAPQAQGKAKKALVQEEKEEEEEEPEPLKLTKAQRKAKNLTQGGQGSGKGQVPQATALPPPESHGGGNGDWNASGSQGSQEGGRGFGRGRIDWRNAICWHCGQKGHTIKFCHVRRNDEDEGLISTNYDGDMYDKFGYYIHPKTPGGTRKEALRRAEADMPPASPTMFRIWQEKEVRCDIRVEEVGENEEVEQGRNADTIEEESIVIESDDEIKEGCWNESRKTRIGEDCWKEARQTMEKMVDSVAKVRIYQQKLADMCEEVKEWRGKEPLVYLYDMGPGSQGGSGNLPGVTISGSTPRSSMAYRPPSRSGRVPHAVRTRAKGPVSPEEPAKNVTEPSGEKEVVDVPGEEEDKDDRLRKEEDEKAEQRAKKRGAKPDTDKSSEGKKKKYVVRVEEGFDVEEIMDRILEGHNHLMNLKDVLALAPRLRDELKARLSRKMVASVRLGTIIPKEAEWAETGTKMDWKSVACGCLDVVIKGKTCTTMVDTGAKMNLIKEEHALRLGMEIDRSDNGVLMGANSQSVFIGTASAVILEIGKVKVRSCFFVMPDLDHPILLGRSFLSRTETVILNKHDGTMFLVLYDPVYDNYEVVTCKNTRPSSVRNRPNPGSFTIEESEEERLRIGGSKFEEEREPETLTLSLASIGDAMDIVSTYGMADPEAMEALREKVVEQMGEGEMELAMVGLSDEVKLQRILKYVLHGHHQEVGKVVDAANGSWARFKDGMQRKYRPGDGLLTTADLEAMNRDDFTTVGAFVQEFKKKARKVPGISEEAQCAIFLGLLTASEASEPTSHGGGSAKLTWTTIDKGIEEGSLDQVEQHHMRLQRRKRKERDAIASGTPGVKRIVTDVLAELGYGKDVVIQKKVVTAVQGKGKVSMVEEDLQEEWEEEESVPQHLSKALCKQRNLARGGKAQERGRRPKQW
ncbi:hypothetical protein CBR_g21879 [Chara braunii]|uniref:CCHC-type domain-containing protein n=1 Tax=Chara braunii TaxID=69332 RepID=A0A388L1G3_CHABU|nr:hypothetical protein CBR_g21879 [Chara braunii]|eukprot:GBG76131.1 hypothetical protein CBR_g21879 [Chara braunii]